MDQFDYYSASRFLAELAKSKPKNIVTSIRRIFLDGYLVVTINQ